MAFCIVIMRLHVMTMQINYFPQSFCFYKKNEGEIIQRISLKLDISRCCFAEDVLKCRSTCRVIFFIRFKVLRNLLFFVLFLFFLFFWSSRCCRRRDCSLNSLLFQIKFSKVLLHNHMLYLVCNWFWKGKYRQTIAFLREKHAHMMF